MKCRSRSDYSRLVIEEYYGIGVAILVPVVRSSTVTCFLCVYSQLICPLNLMVCRGNMDPARDNSTIITKILKLRNEQAKLHGYDNYAAFSTVDSMAQTSAAVMDLLTKVRPPSTLKKQLLRNDIFILL